MTQNLHLLDDAVSAGIDLGASRIKIAIRNPDVGLGYASFAIEEEGWVLERLSAAGELRSAGLTGAGAQRGVALLRTPAAVQVPEFDALGDGARVLLRESGDELPMPFLLVSVGTGTPILRVDETRVRHVGGSPLGGGCALVLGHSLVGCRSFLELAELAESGRRERVDLLLGDIYKSDDSPIRLDATAAHFSKVPRRVGFAEAGPADLADAVWGLIGDNLGLLCGAIAGRESVDRVVVVGSTVQGNPSLRRALRRMLRAHGLEVRFPQEGAHAGARGALERIS